MEPVLLHGRRHGWDAGASFALEGEGHSCWSDEGVHAALRRGINTDIEMELLLAEIRKHLLFRLRHVVSDNLADQKIAATIIQQAINNEFVWRVTAEEDAALRSVLQDFRGGSGGWQVLIVLAMYLRIDGIFDTLQTAEVAIGGLPAGLSDVRDVLSAHIGALQEERDLRATIESYGSVRDDDSRRIADMYERYPYTRWLMWDFGAPGQRRKLLRDFFREQELSCLDQGGSVLVAGCGTGSKVIEYAIGYGPETMIYGIDLSRASLAFAARMARGMGLSNVRFLQMDILELPRLPRQFDIVECTGVLHHMRDPAEGGRAILSRLKPGGILHVSLYSELARRELVRIRAQYGLRSEMEDDEVRAFRQRLLTVDPMVIDEGLGLRDDFFDLSRCRDLLFHPLEHRFTLEGVADFLCQIGVEYRALQKPDLIRHQFWTRYPRGYPQVSLADWAAFEKRNPDAFSQLYEIWAIKPGSAATSVA